MIETVYRVTVHFSYSTSKREDTNKTDDEIFAACEDFEANIFTGNPACGPCVTAEGGSLAKVTEVEARIIAALKRRKARIHR